MRRQGDRTPKPCPHGGRHKHGTSAAYNRDGCRCDPCTDYRAWEWRHRNRLKAYGRFDQAHRPVSEAMAHIKRLQAAGLGYTRIAEVAGIQPNTVWRIATGQTKYVTPHTVQALASAPPGTPRPGHVVDGTGARRRIQALICNGWSMKRLSGQLHLSVNALQAILGGYDVKVSNDLRIREVYGRLWDRTPYAVTANQRAGVTRARRWAEANRWAPPLAWDDDEIDDPSARPSGVRRGRSAA